jgi:RNA polymerase sigma-70 factor (ECF subfamily)
MTAQPRNELAQWLVGAAPELAVHGERLEQAVLAAIARARAAWPALTVADRELVTAIAIAIHDAGDPCAALDELAVEDLYLAQACCTGSPEALAAFAATCDGALAGSLRAMGLAPDVVDELVHDVHTKLFVASGGPPKIASYSGRAKLTSWVRTVATRAAVDRLRRRDDTSDDDGALEAIPDSTDGPELAHFRRTYQAEFKAAFEAALASLEVRERNILRHHFVDNLTLEEIGALYNVHKTTAFRWLEAARAALSKRTRAGFQQRVKLVASELDSVLRLVQSQIDLSLSRVLA